MRLKMNKSKDMTKEQFKTQMKIILYTVMALITGVMGALLYVMDANINLNTRFIGVILAVSFIGHMASIWENLNK